MNPRGKTTGTPSRITRRFLTGLLIGLVLATSLSLVMGAQGRLYPSAAGPTRIMAAGDSNTLGVGTPDFGGYRLSFTQILSSRGFAFHMVGSQFNGPPELVENAHEGYGGYTIDDLASIMPDRLTWNPPDVVLLMIGSNDVCKSVDMPNAPTRLGHLLDMILATPSVQRVILSTIPPINLDWPEGNQEVRDYNAALPGVVAARPNVSLVDLWPQINPATDMADGVHLNSNGAAKLGALFADAVLGAAPPPPPPPPPAQIATSLTLTTSKNPSLINETVTVSGRLLNGTGAGVVGRTVQLEWSGDQATWWPEEQIGTFTPTDSAGRFSGTMAFRGVGAHTEYIRARFAGDSTYDASLSSVVAQGVLPATAPPGAPSPPQVASTATGESGANGWFVSPVTIALTVTGGTSPTIRYRIDDTPWTTYRVPLQVREGRHMVQYQGVDGNGSVGPSRNEYFDVDVTAPTVAASALGLVLTPGDPLTWTGSDALSGIAGYSVSVDGGSLRMIGAQALLEGPWAAGSHSVIVRAEDGAGNVATTTITFRVDATRPPTNSAPGPAPAPTPRTLMTGTVLAISAIALAGAGGLLYGPARRGRTAAKRGRRTERKNPKARRRSVDGPDDDTDYLL